ncbi:MAG: hypothetical protein ACJAYK_000185 [Crocinitomicaceae bacterium]|jgi:hypothetical protein
MWVGARSFALSQYPSYINRLYEHNDYYLLLILRVLMQRMNLLVVAWSFGFD